MDAGSNTDILFNDFISFTTIKNSFLKNEFSSNDWNGSRTNHQAFVKLNEHVGESAVNQLLTAFAKRYVPQEAGSHTTFKLQPLSALHFDADYADVYTRKASMPSLYGLTGIAVFILLIAIVNFITLATAQSMDRAKETGIRKISGSTRSSLIIRFLCETFLLTAIAIAVAAGGLQIVLNNFKSFLPDGVSSTVFSINTWIFIGIVALITTIAAGFYPAKVLSSVAPALSVKGSTIQQGARKSYLVKGLIVFQFAVSLFFIICTMVVGRQVNFMLNKDLGFSKDAIININTNEAYAPAKKHFLAEQIRQLSGVDKVSMSDGTPAATHHWENPLVLSSDPQRTASCILEWGDEHFLPLYNIPVIAGRNLAPSDTIREFIINESCVKALGFTDPKEVIGKYVETITPGGSVSRPVVGVMRDFHSQSLHKAIQPVIFTSSAAFTRGINVKLRSTGMDQFTSSIAQIEKVFKQVYPDEIFEYTFFDQTIAQFYEQEKQTSMLMSFATGIAICISCLGLFGLAALTARQRRKEIGIRKVLGAGVGNLVLLLNKDLFRLVFIAILIATPVALLFMVRWLNSFSFRIGIDWWIFFLAAGIALLVAFGAVAFQSVKAALSNPVDVIRDK
jgi:ABC-type antimicrobial peptide transport system permease subunit